MKVIYVISELFKIYDHYYSLEHCTEFEPNRNYGEFFKNRIMVMSTEKNYWIIILLFIQVIVFIN